MAVYKNDKANGRHLCTLPYLTENQTNFKKTFLVQNSFILLDFSISFYPFSLSLCLFSSHSSLVSKAQCIAWIRFTRHHRLGGTHACSPCPAKLRRRRVPRTRWLRARELCGLRGLLHRAIQGRSRSSGAGWASAAAGSEARWSDVPPYNAISRWHQVPPGFCCVRLLTFHVMVFAKPSPFSISQPALSRLPLSRAVRGPREPANAALLRAAPRAVVAEQLETATRRNLFHMQSVKRSPRRLLFCLRLQKRRGSFYK